jgi:hypothetical protein
VLALVSEDFPQLVMECYRGLAIPSRASQTAQHLHWFKSSLRELSPSGDGKGQAAAG